MAVKDWLIGTLRPGAYLRTESGGILLTGGMRGRVYTFDKYEEGGGSFDLTNYAFGFCNATKGRIHDRKGIVE